MLLAVTAIVGVLIGWRASTISGAAGGDATAAVRGDVKRGAAIVDDAQRLFIEDAGIAYQIAEAEIRSQVDEQHAATADPALAEQLRSDARIQSGLANALVHTSSMVTDPRAAPALDGSDLLDRLADIRAIHPDLTQIDVASTESSAEADRRKSTLLIGTLVPLAVAVLLGSLAEAYNERRRFFLVGGWIAVGASIVLAILVMAVI